MKVAICKASDDPTLYNVFNTGFESEEKAKAYVAGLPWSTRKNHKFEYVQYEEHQLSGKGTLPRY